MGACPADGLFDHLCGGGHRVLVGDGHSCCLSGGLLGNGLTGDFTAFHGIIDSIVYHVEKCWIQCRVELACRTAFGGHHLIDPS